MSNRDRAGHTTSMKRIRRLVTALVGFAAAVGTVITPAGPALANPVYQIVDADHDPYAGIYLRNGTSVGNVTRDAAHYVLYNTSAELICGTWGEAVGPYANRRWHQVRIVSGSAPGRVGWVADRYMNTPNRANEPTPGEPECGATTPPPATPAPPSGTYVSRAMSVRYCVDLGNAGCNVMGPQIAANTSVSMVCWRDGSNFTGDYTTNRWFYVNGPGVVGYVSASVVRNQTAVGWCGSNKAINAAETAVQRYNEAYARTSDRDMFTRAEWGNDRYNGWGEWSGDCPKLPYVGWRASGVSLEKRSAIRNYDTYRSRGMIRSGAAPAGGVVFFRIGTLGHEAISLGNGMVVSTKGYDDAVHEANVIAPLSSYASYLGWVMPG